MSLVSYLFTQLQTKPDAQRWVVAFSGGLDSTVLLHSVVAANKQLSKPRTIVAVHVNHQLSPKADEWQQHCQQQVERWGVECYVERVSVLSEGQGIEAAARQQRYQVFTDFLLIGDYLLLGHHQDDQAETLLLRLLRGAGVLGLGAMSAERSLGQGYLWRPLLDTNRKQLQNYAHANQLVWIEDDSNSDLEFDRNFLRHTILPKIAERWPQVKSQLANTAERLQQSQVLLDDLAEMDLRAMNKRGERSGYSICRQKAIELRSTRFNNMLRYWCRLQNYALPESVHLEQIAQQFLAQEEPATSACVQWGGVECRYFNQRIYLSQSLSALTKWHAPIVWDLQNPLTVSDMGSLTTSLQVATAQTKYILSQKKLDGKVITVARRQGGERCTPVGRQHSQTLKKLLQEYSLETWLRDRVPLIYADNELVAVGDLWINKGFVAEIDEAGWLIHWQPN